MPIAKDLVDAQSGDASTAEEWTRRARRELVGRVVRSPAFARSERLSTLLTYVCDMTLKGRGAELNEQRIGLAVFGRQPDYDSSNDGIVRTQASRLRQRLDQYFSGEGANETVRIEIPKGGYMPIFIEQPLARPGAAELQQQMPPASLPPDAVVDLPKPRRGWWQAAPWVLCCALALLAAAGWLRGRGAAATAAPQHPLWSRIFTPGRPTLEVPGDSGLVLSYLFTHHGVSLSDYIAGTYRMPARPGVPSEDQSIPTDIANRRYTSIVDLLVAVNLQKIAVRSGSSLQVRYARDLRPNDLKNGNAILIGAFEGNPWLAMFEPQMKFRLVNDYRQHIFSVVNNSPQPGEPRVWQSTANDPWKRVYGVIALMPNLSGDGDVLIIEGTSMAGVEAAWDFVSDDQVLLPVLHRMQKADGTLPSFEILVSTENMGASASKANLVATETHSRQ